MKNDAVVQVRMPRFKQLAWRAAAQKERRDLSEWVRVHCDAAAGLEETPFNAAVAVEKLYRQRVELPTQTVKTPPSRPAARQKAGEVAPPSKKGKRSARLGGDSGRLRAKR